MESSNLLDFLRKRKIEEAIISKIVEDNIDTAVIPLMSDHDLAKYIPRYGDRIAVVAFCREHRPSDGDKLDRKHHLLQRVRSRICNTSTQKKHREEVSEKHMGNSYAKKKNRRIELGWMSYCEDDGEFKQVRSAKGGGTRHVSIERHTKIGEIKTIAESLFFPEGKSKNLELKSLHSDMRDIRQRPIDEECTIEEVYDDTKVRLLRLYLCTRKLEEVHSSPNETDDIVILSPEHTPDEDEQPPPDDIQQSIEEPAPIVLVVLDETYFSDTNVVQEPQDLVNQTIHNTSEHHEWSEETGNVLDSIQANAGSEDGLNVSDNQTEDSFDEVIIGAAFPGSESGNLDDTIPVEDVHLAMVLEVRRGFCLTDLMNAFGDPTIMNKEVSIHMKLPNGSFEKGVGSGVFRDCLSEFWNEFYSRCTVGANVKAPYLRHEYQTHEWQAIGRMLVKGWFAAGYFPIQLPLPFLEEALYGVTYSSIRESFMSYITKPEKDILEQALHNFGSVDQDTLIDVLDSHDCHQIPTKENLSALVTQLGHKALIQTPMFVIDCWRPILKGLAAALTPQKLAEIVQQQVPTTKRVKDILKFPLSMSAAQSCVARHLKRYVREMDENGLRLFLRFCTGADILFGSDITVNFIETSEYQCRPQANTCGCYLMLPINYQNYPDLRSDFNAILNSSVWVMDIV